MRKSSGELSSAVRRNRVGKLLLGVSLAIWLTSTVEVYLLSNSSPASMFTFAVWGGVVAGLIGTLRSEPSEMPKGAVWFVFSLTKSLVICGLLLFILRGTVDPVNGRWVSFFYGMTAYMVARDILQTVTSAMAVAAECRRQEARLARQKAKLLAHAAKQPSVEGIPGLSVNSPNSPASAIHLF